MRKFIVSAYFMAALIKLPALFLLTFFSDCHLPKTTKQLAVKNYIVGEYSTSAFSTCNVLSDTLNENAGCFIDTAGILNNELLPSLMDELSKTVLTLHNTAKTIPGFIMDFLKCSRGGFFSIANPGGDWQATDVVIRELPSRQLVFFGANDSLALMAHYTGGLGKTEHILIFKFKNQEIIKFWCGVSGLDLMNKHQLLKYLERIKNMEPRLPTNGIEF
jgi:hypothetical protein